MPETFCPHCRHEFRIPDSFVGKRLRCKNEACKRPFVAELQTVTEHDPVSWEVPQAEWQQELPAHELEESAPLAAGTLPASTRTPAQSPATTYQPSGERYPNLVTYLKWTRFAMNVLLLLALVCIGLIVLILAASLVLTATNTLQLASGFIVLLAVSAFCAGAAYLYYLCMMAMMELIQVVVDIEENTRKAATGGEAA